MSKYGDDNVCTCEMEYVTCKNEFHGSNCELWQEPTFQRNEDEWDGDLGCLVLASSPWANAEEWVWNGDTPVVKKTTAEERDMMVAMAEVISEWEGEPKETHISAEEQEALDALCDGNTQDQYNMICLPDGSYADFENRVTYRKIMADGKPQWVERFWDGEPTVAEKAETVETPIWQACSCTPQKKFYCGVHNCQRDKETDPWRYWAGHTATTPYSGGSSTQYYWPKCNHCFETFELPGLQHDNIKISAKRMHGAGTTPDYGLYAYAGWNPDCIATFIPWQDYGLPKVSFDKVYDTIVAAWDLACEGKTVEVGCMGGHGRTGTILGCFAILSNPEMSAKAAIAHVRKVHCDEAIETNEQEWFVAWFRAHHLGESCPPKPTTYVTKHSANWNAASGAAKAVKQSGATLPLATVQSNPYHDAGTSGNKWMWCSHCKRTVQHVHNKGCPFDTPAIPATEPLKFAPELYKGETANSRRRNAKRANRRKARQARAAQKKAQEVLNG